MKCSWSVSELELNLKNTASEELIKYLNECGPRSDGEDIIDLKTHIQNGNCFRIYPSKSNLFICDEEFIQSCTNPIALFKYYENKISYERIPYIVTKTNDKFEVEKLEYSHEINEIYLELLDTVILDVGSLKKASIKIAPEVFSMISEHNENSYSSCKYLSEFLSLLAISDRIIASDENLNDFEFQIFTKDNLKTFTYSWLELESMKSGFWYTCYKWITSEQQKSVDIKLKRQIVREGITKYYTVDRINSFNKKNSGELIRIFDNTLRLIVSDRTEEYFETQKTLKAEYIDIYSKTFESFSNVVNTILALIVALVAGMYGVLFAQGETLDFFSPNKSIGILLILMLLAELFVFISSILKFNSHKSYLKKLKKINTEKLMISDEDQDCLSKNNSGLVIFIFIVLAIMTLLTAGGIYWFMRTVNS